MIVASDTSPINYLILVGHIEVLAKLFGKVAVPMAVYDELVADGAPDQVRMWAKRDHQWFACQQVQAPHSDSRIDKGEAEAIALARSLQSPLLIDDKRGRIVATELGIPVTGTVSVIERAAILGLLEFELALDALSNTNFRMSKDQLAALISSFRDRYRSEQSP